MSSWSVYVHYLFVAPKYPTGFTLLVGAFARSSFVGTKKTRYSHHNDVSVMSYDIVTIVLATTSHHGFMMFHHLVSREILQWEARMWVYTLVAVLVTRLHFCPDHVRTG